MSASIRSPARGDHPLRARPVHGQPVDEGVGEDGEVRPAPRRVEVREPRVPAGPLDDVRGERGPADGLRRVVRVVEEREAELTGRLEERDMERRRLVRVRRPDAERLARPGEVRRQGRVAPVGPPFVVVLGCADHRHAGVVRGAAADHPRTERPFVLAARPPVVREGERPRVEQVVGPRARTPGGRSRGLPRSGRPAVPDPRRGAPPRRTLRCRRRRPRRRSSRREHTTAHRARIGAICLDSLD